MKILAVDPGDRRLGIAISDPGGTIANPLTILQHVSRKENATAIIALARKHGAEQILIGQALNAENRPTHQSRKAERLAQAIRAQCDLPIVLWDESYSTREVERIQREIKGRRKRQALDDLAATYILQTYLDWMRESSAHEAPGEHDNVVHNRDG